MLIKTEGMAIWLDDEDDDITTTAPQWNFEPLGKGDPLPFPPKVDEKNKCQLMLF